MRLLWWRHGLLGALFALWSFALSAQELLPVPALTARVIDQTGTLNGAELGSIEDSLARFESEHGTQVVVVVVASTQAEDIADFTQRLGDAWQLGRSEVGDGVLFVVAKNDRRMRIATSKALEGAIPDLAARRIIDESVAPAFRRNDYAGGLKAGLSQIFALVKGESLPPPAKAAAKGLATEVPLWDALIFLAFAVPMGAAMLRNLFGNKLGTLLTGVAAGGLAWVLTAVLWLAIGAGLLAMLAAPFVHMLPSASGSSRKSPWGGRRSGGGFGGSGRTGGFGSGRGGNFGGGGASGGW